MHAAGPRPSPQESRPTPAQFRVLRAVASLGGKDVRHADVAEAVGGHPNTVRPHLDALQQAGHVSVGEIRDGHRGRPPRVYHLTASGQRLMAGHGVSDDSALVSAFTSFLISSGHGPDDSHRIGEIWAEALADETSVPDDTQSSGLDQVVEVMDSLGFDPVQREQPTAVDAEYALELRACPILELARANPDFVCRIHEGLIAGVLDRAQSPSVVRLEPFATDTACRVLIQPKP